jgi:peptidoglycan/LPS O-acetylase OafA/YrhL
MVVFILTKKLTPDIYSAQYDALPFTALHGSLGFLSRSTVIHNLCYMPIGAHISQFWSLPLEVILYAAAPFLIRTRKAFYVAAFAGWAIGARCPAESLALQFAFHYALYFAVGVAACRSYSQLRNAVVQFPRVVAYSFISACFGVMLGLSYRYVTGRPGEVVAVVMAIVAIPVCIKAEGGPLVLPWIGEQSYTLYLTHLATVLLVMSVLHRLGVGIPITSPWVWPIAVPFGLLVSVGFYAAVERRTRVWLERARRRPGEKWPTGLRRTNSSAPEAFEDS